MITITGDITNVQYDAEADMFNLIMSADDGEQYELVLFGGDADGLTELLEHRANLLEQLEQEKTQRWQEI